MADLAHADVEVLHSWREGGTNGLKFYCKRVRFTYATATPAVAAAFGMREIVDASGAYDPGNTIPYIAAPDTAGAILIVWDPASAGAEVNAEEVVVVVKGFES